MRNRMTLMAGCLALGLVVADHAQAVTTFSPSQADLFNIVDVTLPFGGGGSLYTGAGTAYGTVGTDAVRYDMDFQPLPPPAGDGFSRVVLQNSTFNTDLTGFDRFDILFQSETLPDMDVKTYVLTGTSGFFQSPLTRSSSNDFEPTRVSIDLSGVPNLNDVRGFGIQMLVPGSPTAFAQTALVQTAPPFVPTQMVEVALIDSFERPTLAGGATGDGWAYAKFEPGPTESDTTFTVSSVGATAGVSAAKLTRGGNIAPFQWSVQRVWTANGDGRPVPADANNDNPNDTEVPIITQAQVDAVSADFNQATHLAFDVTYDPADFDPTATFAQMAVHINDDSGEFYQLGGLAPINPQFITGVTTINVEVPLTAIKGFSSGTPFGTVGVAPSTVTLILGFATNIGDGSGNPVAGAAIIDNIRLLEEVVIVDLPGDLDGDGFVGIGDLNLVLGNWNQSVPPGDPLADPSGDGFVGIEDLNTVLGNWNAGTPPPTAGTVPEPASLALIGFGALATLQRRR